MNDRYLKALHGKNEGRPPVWLMRQAGRYMPSYQHLKKRYSLETLFHNSDLAAEITLLPIQELDVDAAILFSDILVVWEALGFSIAYPDTGGPLVQEAPSTKEALQKISVHNVEETLDYVAQTIKKLRESLTVPLIGFCGGPFTVLSYLLDRPLKEDMKNTKRWLFEEPFLFHQLLSQVTEATRRYLLLQIDSGVHAVQIFDSWAGALSHKDFKMFCLPYLKTLVDTVKEKGIPVTVFCRGSSLLYPEIASIHPTAISFDWQGDLATIDKTLPSTIAIQGNLDPALTRASPEIMERKTKELLSQMKHSSRFIVNLGHGLFPDSRLDTVKRLVETVRNYQDGSF